MQRAARRASSPDPGPGRRTRRTRRTSCCQNGGLRARWQHSCTEGNSVGRGALGLGLCRHPGPHPGLRGQRGRRCHLRPLGGRGPRVDCPSVRGMTRSTSSSSGPPGILPWWLTPIRLSGFLSQFVRIAKTLGRPSRLDRARRGQVRAALTIADSMLPTIIQEAVRLAVELPPGLVALGAPAHLPPCLRQARLAWAAATPHTESRTQTQ